MSSNDNTQPPAESPESMTIKEVVRELLQVNSEQTSIVAQMSERLRFVIDKQRDVLDRVGVMDNSIDRAHSELFKAVRENAVTTQSKIYDEVRTVHKAIEDEGAKKCKECPLLVGIGKIRPGEGPDDWDDRVRMRDELADNRPSKADRHEAGGVIGLLIEYRMWVLVGLLILVTLTSLGLDLVAFIQELRK